LTPFRKKITLADFDKKLTSVTGYGFGEKLLSTSFCKFLGSCAFLWTFLTRTLSIRTKYVALAHVNDKKKLNSRAIPNVPAVWKTNKV